MKLLTISPLLIFCSLHLWGQVEPAVQDTTIKFTLIKRHIETVDETYAGYINQFKHIAVSEMYRTGIPASITLAQAVLESGGGTSELVQQANNHFGIKCGANWTGRTYEKLDDDKDTSNNPVKSCFRKYDKAEESFYDHSEFICAPGKNARYGFLFRLDKTDYTAWACGLESAGYASDNNYAEKLIDLIARYSLFQYDLPAIQSSDSVLISSRIWQINRVNVVLSRPNERLEDIARAFRLDAEKLVAYNDGAYAPGLPLPVNSRVFIAEKQKKWRGQLAYYVVQEGQTMFDVSQQHGIKMADLYRRNGLKPGQEPAAGEQVRLRGRPLFSGTSIRVRETASDINANGTNQRGTN
jgi:hypothetical protein